MATVSETDAVDWRNKGNLAVVAEAAGEPEEEVDVAEGERSLGNEVEAVLAAS